MIRALILTCGNSLRVDDGVGLQIAHSLAIGICDPDTEFYSQQQWTPELAEAISRADLVIFVDASVAVAPGKVRTQAISPVSSATDCGMTHTCSPSGLLALAQLLYGRMPDRSYLITVGGQSFDYSDQLSEIVQRAVPVARERIRALLAGVSSPQEQTSSRTASSSDSLALFALVFLHRAPFLWLVCRVLSSFPLMFSQRTNWKLTPNRFTQVVDHLRSSGTRLLDLTISNPTRCGFAYDSAAIIKAFQSPEMLDYDPQAKGLLSARQAVAHYYAQDHDTRVDHESICLTTSTSEGHAFVFRLLCNAGDEILVPKPSYPLFEFLADLQDVKLVPYSLAYAQGWFVDFQTVEQALTPRTRAILVVHPNNPTGSYLRSEEVRKLNQICSQRELALIADEVFLDYSFTEERHATLADNRDCLTFTLSGLSKIAALPQMKAAWIVTSGPERIANQAADRLEVIADTYLSVNTPTQLAFPALFEQRHSIRLQILQRVLENRAALQLLLATQSACDLLHADGGWYAVLRVPSGRSDEEIAIQLLQQHQTLVHPGHFYDFPDQNHLVLSLITPAHDFLAGMQNLLRMLQ